MTSTSIRLCLLLIFFASAAQAQVSDADFCRNGLFPSEQEHLGLGMIQGREGEKVHFFGDMDGCPAHKESCVSPAYLVPGDRVVVGKSTAEWSCVWYQGRKHESVSWVPKKNVAMLPAPPIRPPGDWVGVWADGPNRIRISSTGKGGELAMLSTLRWEGGTLPNGEPIAHFGGMSGVLHVDGRHAGAAQAECQVRLARIGDYLAADDNGACGGMNVRHTGMYLRRPK